MQIWICDQAQDFPRPELGKKFRQNSDFISFRQSDYELSEGSAKSYLGALDEYKVHHQEQTVKQVITGYEEIVRETESNTTSERGGSTTKGQTIQFRPIHGSETETRDVYQSGNEQLIWLTQKIQELLVGECFAKSKGCRPVRIKYPLVPDSWYFPGLAKNKFEEFVAKIKGNTAFSEPQLVEPTIDDEVLALCGIKKPKQNNNRNGGNGRNNRNRNGAAQRMRRNAGRGRQ